MVFLVLNMLPFLVSILEIHSLYNAFKKAWYSTMLDQKKIQSNYQWCHQSRLKYELEQF